MEPTVNIALRAARKAGDIIARASDDLTRLKFEAKGKADFVTEIDLAAEEEIIGSLQKTYPDHAFLCEESGRSGPEDAEHLWIIDPLDGTSNFMRGIPHFCVSIACVSKGQLEHAVILDPIRQEEFTASRGRGAQLNGRRMRSNRSELRDSLIGTGTPFLGHCDDRLIGMSKVLRRSQDSRWGSDAWVQQHLIWPMWRQVESMVLGSGPECLGHRGRNAADQRVGWPRYRLQR